MSPSQETEFLESAADFGRRALTDIDTEMLVRFALDLVTEKLHVEFSSLFELLPNGSTRFLGGPGWSAEGQDDPTVELAEGSAAGQVIRTLEPLVVADIAAEPRLTESPLHRRHNVASFVFVPLCGKSRPLGVLGAHCQSKRTYAASEVAWLQTIANVLASRFERKWLSQGEYDRQLLRAEQMMAIGQVAAGVAHELRNPLTSIKGLVQVNLRDMLARGLPAEDLAVVEHEIRRMERTLQTFLDFARPPIPERHLVDLTTTVERVLALVGGRARKQQVEISFLHPPSAVDANVDQDQIQQLILNLVLNALDAMPQGGNIEIDLRPPRDGFLELYVRDNGPGIPPHILPKVFETFVSSKETGVGLGLPLSRRIAEDHGGNLSAYNLPSAGACFLLRLPAE